MARPRVYTLNESAFDDAPTNPEAAYWIGFLMADGCVSIHGRQHHLVLQLADKDREHVAAFREFLGSNHPLSFRRKVTPSGYVSISHKLEVNSRRLVEALHRYGVTPRKSFTAEVSMDLARSADFWRGYVDGDGHVNMISQKPGSARLIPLLSLSIGSRALLVQFGAFIRPMLAGRPVNVRPKKGANIHLLALCGAPAGVVIRALYERAGPALPRKAEVARAAMGWRRLLPRRDCYTFERLLALHDQHGTWENAARAEGVTCEVLTHLWARRKKKMGS